MRFAVPTNDKKLCAHFGHCEAFALIDADGEGKLGRRDLYYPAAPRAGSSAPLDSPARRQLRHRGRHGGQGPAALRGSRREGGYGRAGGIPAGGGGELPEGDPRDRGKHVRPLAGEPCEGSPPLYCRSTKLRG